MSNGDKAGKATFSEVVYAPAALSLISAVPIGIGAGVIFGFIVLELGVWGENPLNAALSAVVYAVAAVAVLGGLVSLNFSRLNIRADAKGLTLQQGLSRQRISWSQIKTVTVADSGPRFLSLTVLINGLLLRRVWKTPATATGLEVMVKSGSKMTRYYISSIRNNELSAAVKAQRR